MPEKPGIDSEIAKFLNCLFHGETMPVSPLPGQGQEPVAPMKNTTGIQVNRFIPFLNNPNCFVSGVFTKNNTWYLRC